MASLRTTLVLLLTAGLLTSSLIVPNAASAQEAGGNVRRGLFGGLGFGVGVGDCLGGLECDFGGSGNARIGGTVSDRWRLAFATHGYVSNDYEFGAATFQALFNPGGGDFFLLFGAGAGTASGWSTVGLGLVGGLGIDISINGSGSLALTPFLNFIYTTDEANWGNSADFLQAGLGLTFN